MITSADPVQGVYCPDAFFFSPQLKSVWTPEDLREGKKFVTWLWTPKTGMLTGNGFATHGTIKQDNWETVQWDDFDAGAKGRISADKKICSVYDRKSQLWSHPMVDALLSLFNFNMIAEDTEIHTASAVGFTAATGNF